MPAVRSPCAPKERDDQRPACQEFMGLEDATVVIQRGERGCHLPDCSDVFQDSGRSQISSSPFHDSAFVGRNTRSRSSACGLELFLSDINSPSLNYRDWLRHHDNAHFLA